MSTNSCAVMCATVGKVVAVYPAQPGSSAGYTGGSVQLVLTIKVRWGGVCNAMEMLPT